MLRPAEPGRLTWHVYARGTRRLELFRGDDDFLQFLGLLKKALDAKGIAMWAYVLMSNHYHFVLTATSEELTAFMRWINHSYSLYHNRKYGFRGHAFEGPFQAHVQKGGFLAFSLLAYVFRNPVDAGMVDAPEDYRWSSYRAFMGLSGAPLWLDPYPFLQLLADNAQDARVEFTRIMAREARMASRPVKDKLTWTELARRQFESLLDEALARHESLEGQDPVLVAMYWARQAGIPPRAMVAGARADGPRYPRVSLHRFMKRLAEDPGLALRLSPP